MDIRFNEPAELVYNHNKYRYIQVKQSRDGKCLICDAKDGVCEWIPLDVVESSNVNVLVLPLDTKALVHVVCDTYSYTLEIKTKDSTISICDLDINDTSYLDKLTINISSYIFGFRVRTISYMLYENQVFKTRLDLLEIFLNCRFCEDADWMLNSVFANHIRLVINKHLSFLSCTNLFAGNFYVRHIELINKDVEPLDVCFNSLLEKNVHLETFTCLGLDISLSTTVNFGKNLRYVITDSVAIFYSWFLLKGCRTVLFLADSEKILDRFSG